MSWETKIWSDNDRLYSISIGHLSACRKHQSDIYKFYRSGDRCPTPKWAPGPRLQSMLSLSLSLVTSFIFKGRCFVCWLVGCLTSQQQARVSQGPICSDKCTCGYTETEVADQTFYLTHSQYADTGPTSPSADPIMPGAWQGSHWKNPVASGIRTPNLPFSRRTP